MDYARWGYSTMISEIQGGGGRFFPRKITKFFSDLGGFEVDFKFQKSTKILEEKTPPEGR